MPESSPADRLRAICLALPEATEQETWELPTYRVRNKIFVKQAIEDGRVAFWCKALPGAQPVLVGSDPEVFFVPPYVGHNGWIGVRLDRDPDWAEVADLIAESYRLTAPKRLAVTLDAG